ncbi:hypothetical protein HGB07_05305 [Candidatus Roizmanbacteria bacterium]|nr:hypothetical protein [Candidatus Roizmanbacteria bacterium]
MGIVVSLCLVSIAFAAPKKKKKTTPVENETQMHIDEESCGNKAIDARQLFVTNPYDTMGKCYWIDIPVSQVQLLSRSTALIGVGTSQKEIFALMNFGEESVPMGWIQGLAMGLGAYKYETASGSINTVHHLRKLPDYLDKTKIKMINDALKSTKKTKPDAREQ